MTSEAIPVGLIAIWSGAVSNVPSGWALCDGTNGTPDLRDKFVLGGGGTHAVGDSGGEETVTLTTETMPVHRHDLGRYSTTQMESSASGFKAFPMVTSKASALDIELDTVDAGSGEPHNNMPPYYTLCYIMKVFF